MGKTHRHYPFGTINRQKILLAASSVALASLFILCLNFPRAGGRPYPNSQAPLSSPQPEQIFSDSAPSTPNEDNLAEAADVSVDAVETFATDVSTGELIKVIEFVPEQPSETALDAHGAYLPFVFLDYTDVLPATATEELAAAVQNLKQDFIVSTGLGTADPADPDYAQRWEQAQPIADEIFRTIAGTEAYNAMSIMRARQLGRF